jgi:hypothetical protein
LHHLLRIGPGFEYASARIDQARYDDPRSVGILASAVMASMLFLSSLSLALRGDNSQPVETSSQNSR